MATESEIKKTLSSRFEMKDLREQSVSLETELYRNRSNRELLISRSKYTTEGGTVTVRDIGLQNRENAMGQPYYKEDINDASYDS